MTKDNSKGVTIKYNYLNLPYEFNFVTGERMYITYNADGKKLRKDAYAANGVKTQFDYVGAFEYTNGKMSSIIWSDGRVMMNPANGIKKLGYVLRDHLGNNRVTFTDFNGDGVINGSTEISQQNHYYAFGMNMEGPWSTVLNSNFSISKSRYQYNGKELNTEFGLNWNDYGARWYDPAIARWSVTDPLCEKFSNESPNSYAGNNPIKNIDVKGSFRFPVALVQYYKDNYPYFYSYIQSGFGETILNSPLTMSTLSKYSVGTLTKGQITADSKFGTGGPVISVEKNVAFDGQTVYPQNQNSRDIVIQINEGKILNFENIMKNPKATDVQKKVALLSIHSTLINEYTQYGDALDGYDAIKLPDGTIANGSQSDFEEGFFVKKAFDEGNEAALILYGSSSNTGDYLDAYYLRNDGKMIYRDNGIMNLVPNTLPNMGIDKTLIPSLPQKSK